MWIHQNDAVKQYNACIDTWSLRHLTSAEEYPDEEYLDMSKSSSLQNGEESKTSATVVEKKGFNFMHQYCIAELLFLHVNVQN